MRISDWSSDVCSSDLRAEIVDGETDAQALDLVKNLLREGRDMEEHRLRDLQLEPVRIDPALGKRRDQRQDKTRFLKLERRDVDGDRNVRRPARGLRACGSQHPFADAADEAGFFGDGYELHR